MRTIPESTAAYRNVMESLVIEEVDRQMQRLPEKVANYVNRTEVIAFALNRLPALYATTAKGWQQQCSKAHRDFQAQIATAVRQGIIAVQRDPLRSASPLKIEEEQLAQAVLLELRNLLRYEDLSWHNLVDIVEQTLLRTARGEITWRKREGTAVEKYDWHRYRI
ncbi:MAG: late competence development ComFB family protein [Leptolyngbyaceae cyanobacterium]